MNTEISYPFFCDIERMIATDCCSDSSYRFMVTLFIDQSIKKKTGMQMAECDGNQNNASL